MIIRTIRVLMGSSLICVLMICAASADPIFWLQTTDVAGTPAPLQLNNGPGATGTLYLFGSSDTALMGGFGIDLVSSNAALSFTAPATNGPLSNTAWAIANPGTVSANSVKNMIGFTLGTLGTGFGPGSSIGNTMLLASVGYKLGSSNSTNTISLVNSNGVIDASGYGLNFHVGSAQSPTLSGDDIGATASLGTASVCGICGIGVFPKTIDNVSTRTEHFVSTLFDYYIDLNYPYTTSWSNFKFLDYAGPASNPSIVPATFDNNAGKFVWDTTGAALGTYRWQATLSAGGFFSTGILTVKVTQVPEPANATMLLVGLFAGGSRRWRTE